MTGHGCQFSSGGDVVIAVKFDDRTWGRLVTMADRQGVPVAQLIEAAAQRLTTGTSTVAGLEGGAGLARSRTKHRQALAEQVVALRQRGHTIVGIAQMTGYSKSYVSKILCENGQRTWSRTDAQDGQNGRTA